MPDTNSKRQQGLMLLILHFIKKNKVKFSLRNKRNRHLGCPEKKLSSKTSCGNVGLNTY